MRSDGSGFGLTADQSLRAVLGDRDNLPDQGMSPSEMAAYLEEAPNNPDTYDDVSRWIGKQVMHWLADHPEQFKTMDAYALFDAVFPVPTETTRFSSLYPQLEGISGFMVGWGCNAARYAWGHNEMPNPSIVTIEVKEKP